MRKARRLSYSYLVSKVHIIIKGKIMEKRSLVNSEATFFVPESRFRCNLKGEIILKHFIKSFIGEILKKRGKTNNDIIFFDKHV